MSANSPAPNSDAPLLRVINPDATSEEIAAIIAVLSALGGEAAPAPAPQRSLWAAPARMQRVTGHSGPGAWRASGLPR